MQALAGEKRIIKVDGKEMFMTFFPKESNENKTLLTAQKSQMQEDNQEEVKKIKFINKCEPIRKRIIMTQNITKDSDVKGEHDLKKLNQIAERNNRFIMLAQMIRDADSGLSKKEINMKLLEFDMNDWFEMLKFNLDTSKTVFKKQGSDVTYEHEDSTIIALMSMEECFNENHSHETYEMIRQ